MIKAAFVNNKVWKVPFSCIISEQTVQVVAMTEEGISARKGAKKSFVSAPPELFSSDIPASGFKFFLFQSLRLREFSWSAL